MHNCSFCGKTGHNKLTCLVAELSLSLLPDIETTTRKTYCCSICGDQGHNSQRCGKKETGTPPKKAQRHCKRCGESGHNIRTCSAPYAAESQIHLLPGSLCSPCAPSTTKTYKRKQIGDTHTIKELHIQIVDHLEDPIFGQSISP
jgi:hypothetical protein